MTPSASWRIIVMGQFLFCIYHGYREPSTRLSISWGWVSMICRSSVDGQIAMIDRFTLLDISASLSQSQHSSTIPWISSITLHVELLVAFYLMYKPNRAISDSPCLYCNECCGSINPLIESDLDPIARPQSNEAVIVMENQKSRILWTSCMRTYDSRQQFLVTWHCGKLIRCELLSLRLVWYRSGSEIISPLNLLVTFWQLPLSIHSFRRSTFPATSGLLYFHQ